MDPPRELPGMYWDPDKKKYFAITRAHTAPKTSAAANYTTSAVRLKKKQARHKEELRRISERKKNAIVKSGITNPRHSSLQAGTLARELGNIKGDAIDDLRCRAPVAAWDAEELVADIDRGIARPADHWRPCFPCFAWDPVRSALLIRNRHVYRRRHNTEHYWNHQDAFEPWSPAPYGGETSATRTSSILEWLPKSSVMLKASPSHRDGRYCLEAVSQTASYTIATSLPWIESIVAAPANSSILGAVVCRPDRPVDVRRISIALLLEDGRCKKTFRGPFNATSVDILPTTPTILITGHSNNLVKLCDQRTPGLWKQDAAAVFEHPSCVNHLKAIDEHRVLVAGAYSMMAQYDLRYLTSKPASQVWSSRPTDHTWKLACPTILQYPGYENHSRGQLGFAVDLEAGLVAAAQDHEDQKDDEPACVRIFSLHRGEVLRHILPDMTRFSKHEAAQHVRSMRFVDDSHGRSPKSLFMVQAKTMMRYGV